VPLVPIAGGLLAGIAQAVIPSGGKGPGVTKVMYAVHRRKSQIPWYLAARKWIASTLTISSGGSAGAEGPIVTIGSVIGSNVGRLVGANPQNTAALLGCGAAAGIASVFNAPIAGVFFVLEIMLRDFSLRTFTPIVIASVISSACTQAVLGNEALFNAGELFIAGGSAEQAAFAWHEIPNYLMLGMICGVIAAVFIRGIYFTGDRFAKLPVPEAVRPAIGAALLGGLGLGALWLSSRSGNRHAPAFYGNGYGVIKDLLTPTTYLNEAGTGLGSVRNVLLVLLVLGVFKAVATCLTVGSGGAGGMFAPSLLLGASAGGAFGYLVQWIGWFPSASPAHYALVGMAAMVAATTHAPLTAILIVYEITQNYEVILPLMCAADSRTIVGRLVYSESVYTVKLTEQGVRLGGLSDLTILSRLHVGDVPLVSPVFVHPEDSAQRLLELSEKMSVNDFVVTDRHNRYLGLVTGADLKEALVYREAIPLLQVSELQRSDLPTVTIDESLDVVLDKFSKYDVHGLAVLDERGSGAVLGLVTRLRLMGRYQAALSSD
jgi:CIC family chloride channel protein